MAQDERLDFDIFARLREDGFSKAGRAASAASDDVLGLARRLDELSKKSATARVGLAGDKEALAQLDKLDLKLLTTGRKVVDPKISLDGAARAQAEIAALEVSLDKLGSKSADVTESVGSGGLAGPAGMGALIGAGVALSPVLATVTTGLGGFGLAAAGSIGPVMKAAQATGGLRANMAKLDPEQQRLARSILGLGRQYDVFQKALEPQVLNVFGKGIQTAGHLMHDVQPVAEATGKALGSMLGQIDKEFQSNTWQNFFGFMARTAGPDIQLLTNNFTDFMQLLPPLLQDLQPVASGILQLTDDILKLGAAAIKVSDAERHLAAEAHNSSGFFGELTHAAERAVGQLLPGIPAAQKLGQAIARQADASSKAGPGLAGVGSSAAASVTPVFNLQTAVDDLTKSMQKNVSTVLTLQGDDISWQQSLQAATKQLNSNSAGLRGNSKDALANKAAVLQNTQQAVQFAQDQLTLGHNLQGASQHLQDQIHWLQVHGEKSKFATAEIHALRVEENKLRAAINQKINVDAAGTWKVLPGGTRTTHPGPISGAAGGMYVAHGQPGVDDQLIMAQRGELVVPTPLVSAGLVDHLRGMIPGFASGGVIGNYSGSVGGLPKWLAMEDSATLRALESATARATSAGIRSAQSSFGAHAGPGGGAPSANAALARKLYPPWAHGAEWAAWNAVAMRESGWSNYAYNARSGATGIPQALPYTKMPRAAWLPSQGGSANPTAQITWMIGYIKGRYGDPIGALAHENKYGWYAKGGPVGGKAAPPDPQRKKWLAQLERDVKLLHEDQKHARQRRKILHQAVEIDQLWFLTHPNVRKHGIGYDEHERALRNDERRLSGFNKREADKEKTLAAKIRILRDLTGYPRGKKYGGPGTPGPDPGAGDGGGDGGGDTGGGVSAPPGPPPIPPPPMPEWMVAAGLGGSPAPSFPAQMAPGGSSFPEPVTYPGGYGGWTASRAGSGTGLGTDAVAAIHQLRMELVNAIGMVAPGTTRGMNRNLNSMAAQVAGRFS